MQPQFCANESCRRHTEQLGGKFTVRISDGKTFCHECWQWAGTGATCKNLWQFETTHFTGYKTEVKSLAHLRQLEKQYGCSNHAANHDQRNWS